MAERYSDSEIVINKSELYTKTFQDRNVKMIRQFGTENFNYPTVQQRRELKLTEYIWKNHDKLWRLSNTFYGDPNYWWVIAFYNKKATEFEFSAGELIYIPQPLDKILFFIKG
jgi:nucleoid-associated protein YgaU